MLNDQRVSKVSGLAEVEGSMSVVQDVFDHGFPSDASPEPAQRGLGGPE